MATEAELMEAWERIKAAARAKIDAQAAKIVELLAALEAEHARNMAEAAAMPATTEPLAMSEAMLNLLAEMRSMAASLSMEAVPAAEPPPVEEAAPAAEPPAEPAQADPAPEPPAP